jgi:UDP-glucose 4-epimerase
MRSRVLVTGAHGFVGTWLCRALIESGRDVVAAHRRDVSPGAIPGAIPVYLPLGADPADWQRSLQFVDCVVHLAAHVHRMDGRADEAVYEAVNVGGTRAAAEQAARAGVRRFVFLSSAKVNGEGVGLRRYRADDPCDPQDAYARSKAAAERTIGDVCARSGMEYVIIRPPLVHGPGVRANFHKLLRLAELAWPLPLASIHNRRSLVGLANLADFIVRCVSHREAAGQVWLVTDGEDISTPDLIGRLSRLMHRPSRLFPCPPRMLRAMARAIGCEAEAARLCESFVLDASPARNLLGWRPPLSLDEGLEQAVAGYLGGRQK